MVDYNVILHGGVFSDPTDLGPQATTDGAGITQRRPISRHLVDGMLRAADTLILMVSALLAYIAYLELFVEGVGSSWSNYGMVVLLAAFLQVNLFNLAGVYARTPAQLPRLRLWRVVGI